MLSVAFAILCDVGFAPACLPADEAKKPGGHQGDRRDAPASWNRSACRLSQERFEHVLVDVGELADLDVPYVLAIAFEQAPWVF
jgi:hypothetical protein